MPQMGYNQEKSRNFRPFGRLLSVRKGKERAEPNKQENEDKRASRTTAREVFWPEDLLKVDFPQARILTFGYNTVVTKGFRPVNQGTIFSHSGNLLHDLTRERKSAPSRDLIFIAHSLGGIITKEVLRLSHTDFEEQVQEISKCTTGVFFFGTPHRGSKDWASFARDFTIIARILGMDVNTAIIKELVPGDMLEQSQSYFMALWTEYRQRLTVRTFRETKAILGTGLGGLNELIVPRESSTLGHFAERAQDIDADHMGMVRFTGPDDDGYKKVKPHIEDLVQKAAQKEQDAAKAEVKETPKRIARISISDLSKEQRDCLQLLRPWSDGRPWPYERPKDKNPERLEGTCSWFFGNNSFQEWLNSDRSAILWLSADPGCGKSVLSKSLADIDLRSTQSRTTCYFFFKDDDDKTKSNCTALSVLLHQLFQAKPSLIHNAMDAYGAEQKGLVQSFHQLWNILTKTASDPKAGEIICILDALDECAESDRNELIHALKVFYNPKSADQSHCQLKFFVTSRGYLDIERHFLATEHFPTLHVPGEEESEAISYDIDIVLKERISELGTELSLTAEEQLTLEKGLRGIKHRTFLWAKLIIPFIRETFDSLNKDLEAIIRILPPTVEKEYEAILSKIKDSKRPYARKLFHILIAAARPLSLKELNIALGIEDHHTSYEDLHLDSEARFETTIRNICGLFVTVIDQKVYLIHQTAKEFLIAKNEESATGWQHSLKPIQSELLMARTCISYLMFADFDGNLLFETTDEPDRTVEGLTNAYEYLQYATSFWITHFRNSQAKVANTTLQSALEVCDPQSQRFQTWSYVYRHTVDEFTSLPLLKTPIMVASYLGLSVMIQPLLARNVDVDSTDECGRTPLSWAAHRGHEATVRLLVDKGKANVNSKDNDDRTPLWWATNLGHEATVRLLIGTCKADVELEDDDGRTPLWFAVFLGYEAIVRLLIDTGKFDVNSRDYGGRTPLWWAAIQGHEAVVELLINMDKVDVDPKDNESRTPLWVAAFRGHATTLRLLVDTGKVDVNAKDKDGQTPLFWAALRGHEAIARLLIETGKVDLNVKDEDGRTPLFRSAEHGYEGIFRLLVDTGADVDMRDNYGCTPLTEAAAYGHEAIVRLLVGTGKVDVDAKDNNGQTPLSKAGKGGYWGIVRLLVDTGKIDVNSEHYADETLLQNPAIKEMGLLSGF